MKNKLIHLFILFVTLPFMSCEKFLDVKPKDKFLEEDLSATKFGLYNTLNGIYLGLADQNLYGAELSMTTIDLLGQYYSNNSDTWKEISNYNYTQASSKSRFETIWAKCYTSIMNINSFINLVTNSKADLEPNRKEILLGEGYGLRAYLHFDLLRLYGPLFLTNKISPSIPYMKEATAELQKLLPAEDVIKDVLNDLELSINYLKYDPIIKEGLDYNQVNDPALDFFKMRNRRMNYFAALTLKARVQLYMGDKAGAYVTATKVIDEAGSLFAWSPSSMSMPNILNPDRIFSSEVIFGIDNYSMYDVYLQNFDVSNVDQNILAPLPDRLNTIFENNENDYRFRVNWISGASGGKAYRVFIKYRDIVDKAPFYRNFQPMLRMSELYLIAAECANSNEESLFYINELRKNRGLPALTVLTNKMTILLNEYRKEFWGEGQMFYFYKRNAVTSILNGKALNNVQMNETKYRVPIPDSELINRQN